jgi:hypothetical protein
MMRIASNTMWIVIPLVVLLLAILQALSPSGGTLQAAELAKPEATPGTYVSSDPSVPPATGVQFPEPASHIETF